MPNYRLTHKMTGTTVPVIAGYYGLHSQSTTKWKMAGSEMYAWKSDDFANAYFMGVTIDADAYKTVTISGATDSDFNGAYVYSSTVSKWLKSTTHSLFKDGTTWKLTDGAILYTAADNGLNIPPATFALAPSSTATLSVTSSAKFAATALGGTWYPVNGGSGTPVYSEYTIGEAWETAEKSVFDSLKAWLGGTEGKDCFRGYLPFQNVEKKFVDVWMLTSGGTAGAFEIERTYGMSGAWCSVMQNADLEAIFENRTTAMHFAGAVMAWIKSTNNLNQIVNVNWCRLRNLPDAPKEIIEGNRRFWEVKIPLEMLYLTESLYA